MTWMMIFMATKTMILMTKVGMIIVIVIIVKGTTCAATADTRQCLIIQFSTDNLRCSISTLACKEDVRNFHDFPFRPNVLLFVSTLKPITLHCL
jgi:hypothetical protein